MLYLASENRKKCFTYGISDKRLNFFMIFDFYSVMMVVLLPPGSISGHTSRVRLPSPCEEENYKQLKYRGTHRDNLPTLMHVHMLHVVCCMFT